MRLVQFGNSGLIPIREGGNPFHFLYDHDRWFAYARCVHLDKNDSLTSLRVGLIEWSKRVGVKENEH